jgi:hypothetical protein
LRPESVVGEQPGGSELSSSAGYAPADLVGHPTRTPSALADRVNGRAG